MPICQTPFPSKIAVALPVKDEQSRIQSALTSLEIAARRVGMPVAVVIIVNNTTDATTDRVREIADELSLLVHLHEVAMPALLSNAGSARRLAMEIAAELSPGGVLMTTDADAIVTADWFQAALAQLGCADLVCGAVDVRTRLQTSPLSRRITRVEHSYADALHHVRFAVDRVTGRQAAGAPPHYVESGAALAMWTRTYDALGGLPAVTCSEDRALVHTAEAHGLRVRYSNAMQTYVSARLDGRADGGMADCLKARLLSSDPLADQAMLPLADIVALWDLARSGQDVLWPDRSVARGPRLRASDLEAALPRLRAFVSDVVRPQSLAGRSDAA